MERLTVAVQNSDGRMGQESLDLLSAADFYFQLENRVDICEVSNFPLTIELSRNVDIPDDVQRGFCDFGISGLDRIVEAKASVVTLIPLGFGRCRLQVGVKKDLPYRKPQDLNGLTVVTSYPNLSQDYFAQNNTEVDLLVRSGKVEKFIKENRAQACVDITSSGKSMKANGIEPYDVLLNSEAMLIASPMLKQRKGSECLVQKFLMSIVSALRVRDFTYIVMNAPESTKQAITSLLPSKESPTISPLNEKGWWSISSLVPRRDFRKIISELQESGARDILEIPPKQIIPNPDDRVIIELMKEIYG